MSRRKILAAVAALVELAMLAGCGAQPPSGQDTGQTGASAFTLFTVAGYTVPEDARGVAAIGNGALTEVSPVWYQPTESGGLIFASRQAERSAAAITTAAQSDHVALIPSISNYRAGQWDSALIHQIISDPQTRAAHITTIVDMTKSHQWAGIDIDYESLSAADRSGFSAFIGELGSALRQAGKRLTVTVHAKTSEPGDWSGARAQDWKALGAAAGEVRVMASTTRPRAQRQGQSRHCPGYRAYCGWLSARYPATKSSSACPPTAMTGSAVSPVTTYSGPQPKQSRRRMPRQ